MILCLIASFHLAATNTEQVSESLGHIIGKHLEELGLPLDLDALAKGLQEEAAGKPAPLEEEDCLAQMAKLQKEQEAKIAEEKRANAEALLNEERSKPGIVSCLGGKLLYKVLKSGHGTPLASYNSPIVRWTKGGVSTEERLSLIEAPLTLQKGLAGMRQGEVRTLFIHPDLYESSTLTVELLQVDAQIPITERVPTN